MLPAQAVHVSCWLSIPFIPVRRFTLGQIDRQIDTTTDRHRQTDRQIDRQIDTQAVLARYPRQIDIDTLDRQIEKYSKQIDRRYRYHRQIDKGCFPFNLYSMSYMKFLCLRQNWKYNYSRVHTKESNLLAHEKRLHHLGLEVVWIIFIELFTTFPPFYLKKILSKQMLVEHIPIPKSTYLELREGT